MYIFQFETETETLALMVSNFETDTETFNQWHQGLRPRPMPKSPSDRHHCSDTATAAAFLPICGP